MNAISRTITRSALCSTAASNAAVAKAVNGAFDSSASGSQPPRSGDVGRCACQELGARRTNPNPSIPWPTASPRGFPPKGIRAMPMESTGRAAS